MNIDKIKRYLKVYEIFVIFLANESKCRLFEYNVATNIIQAFLFCMVPYYAYVLIITRV